MKIPRKPTLPGWNHSRVLQVAWFAMTLNETLWAMVNHCRWLGKISLGSLPLDKTIVFHFYDFVLVLSAVSSRCQLYSVGPSEGKLIPNSVFFIQSFREFRAWVPTKDGFAAWPVKTRYPRSIESFSFEWNPIENATTIRVLDALHFESACQASFWSKLKGGKFALQKDFAVIPEQTHDISEDS